MLEVQSSGGENKQTNQKLFFFFPGEILYPKSQPFASWPMSQQIQCLGQVLGTSKCLRVAGPWEELVLLSKVCL